jgi:hypothetical protein
VSTLLHATPYVFLPNLLNVLVQIANKNWITKKSHNPIGLHGLLQGQLYFFFVLYSMCVLFVLCFVCTWCDILRDVFLSCVLL